MKVLELLDEIEEIIDSASTVPVVRKVMVDPNEISEIVKEIRLMLPDEISNAQLIINEKNRVLEDAKKECEKIIQEAQAKADQLVEQDEIKQKQADIADDTPATEQISADQLHQLISELPDGYRTVLNLYVFEDYSHRQIAELLGIKESTSASQLHYAKQWLARRIKEIIIDKE